MAHDGTRAPIQLVDEKGCVPLERQKIMSPFKKIKNFDATANVLSYAYFQVSLHREQNNFSQSKIDHLNVVRIIIIKTLKLLKQPIKLRFPNLVLL